MVPVSEQFPEDNRPGILALVAGGKSSRMGHDKAFLRLDGETVVERTVRIARDAGFSQVWVIGRETPIEPSPGIHSFGDDFPDRGPLEGIATGLRRLTPETFLSVLPCDLPRLTVPALVWMASITRTMPDNSVGWTLVQEGRRQPLVSAWSVASLPRIESSLSGGKGSVSRCADALGLQRVEVPDVYDICFRGANTPSEWHALTGQPVSSPKS